MLFTPTQLDGVVIIDMELIEDERGWFARSFCQHEFEEHNLNPCIAQCNVSFNAKAGTLRGMHYQESPHGEAKLIRCTRGSIYDVLLDVRADSPTFKQWVSVELSQDNHRMVYAAEGLAHGFQTLEDNTEVFYEMSEFYHPESGRGIRWDDPAFRITWPLPNPILSERDRSYPDWKGE
jgi:dTDP-4-dehydrorhamnose 3,5-epimerase